SSVSGRLGRPAARPAAMLRASGRRAQAMMISSAAPGSAATRARPSRRASISCASTSPSTSTVSGTAPSAATSPVSSLRLVTTTSEPGAPGSRGRTWATLRALSRTISICLSSSRLRNSAERPSAPAGIRYGGTPSASRKNRSASAGSIGGVAGSTRRGQRQLGRRRRAPVIGPGPPLPAIGRRPRARVLIGRRGAAGAADSQPVRDRKGRIHGQYLLVDAGQIPAGIDAQLLGQHPAALGEYPQRLGVPPAAVERDHQQPAHPLAQRVIGHHRGQVGHDLLVPAERQQHGGAIFGGGRAELPQPDPRGPGRLTVPQAGINTPTPGAHAVPPHR